MADLVVATMDAPFGVEVTGLEPGTLADEGTRTTLRSAFDDRGLLLFRGLDVDQGWQGDLAEILIGREPDRAARDAVVSQDRSFISNRVDDAVSREGRLLFHSDTMWAREPLLVLSLYGVEVDQPAVPTIFASGVHAWATLPDDLRDRVEGLHAVHTAGQHAQPDDPDVVESLPEQPQSSTTPLALPHPRTGRTVLFLCEQMTHQVVELPPEESDELLAALLAHLYDPANLLRHDWREGDLVVWDNLAVQHSRPAVRLDGPARTLRRFCSPLENIALEARRFRYAPAPR